MRTRTLVLVALGGLALAAIGTALVVTSDHVDDKGPFLALALTVGLSFLASGVIALWRRPQNRTGVLLVLVAYLWFLGALGESNNDWVFTLGVIVNSFTLGAFVQLLLAYPTGRLQSRRDLWLVIGTYVVVLVASIGQLLVDEDPDSNCPDCTSTIAVANSEKAHDLLSGVLSVVALGLVLVVLAIVVTRFIRAKGALRRALGPVLGAGALVMVVLLAQLVVGDDLRGRCRAAVLRLPRHVRARAGGVSRRRPPQPPRAQRRRRPARRARPRCSAAGRARPLPPRPVARPRLLAARAQAAGPAGRHPVPRRRRHPSEARRAPERPARRRAHPRSLARGRTRARRRGRGGGGALARERTSAGRGAGAVRLPRDDRQHGTVAADVSRPGWADRQLQHGLRAGERLRQRRGCPPRVLLGRLHLACGARRGARSLREESRPSRGDLGEHVRQPARRGDGDRVVDRAAPGRGR